MRNIRSRPRGGFFHGGDKRWGPTSDTGGGGGVPRTIRTLSRSHAGRQGIPELREPALSSIAWYPPEWTATGAASKTARAEQVRVERQDAVERNEIERKFDEGKRLYGLGLMRAMSARLLPCSCW
jgi:hypothetical protein